MSESGIDGLRDRVRGDIITPDDPGYDEARKVYNAMIDRRPRLIVRAVDAGDVMAAVDYARENGLDLAVRGGSHSVPGFGTCDDGVVIDLGRHARCARGPGAAHGARRGRRHLGRLQPRHATPSGWPPPAASSRRTGIGGLTLGGGIGHLARGFGLSIDNLISADVVTADGRLRRRQRARERGPLLGAARRRRQLRRCHVVRVQAAPASRMSTAGRCSSSSTRRERCCASTATSSATAPEELAPFPGLPDRAAAALHPGGARTATHVPHRRGLLGGRAGRRREGRSGHPRCGAGGGRVRRTDALPGDQRGVRRPGPARPAALLEGQLRRRSSTTAQLRAHLEYGPKVPTMNSRCTSTRSTAPCTVWPRTQPRSPTATRTSPR